LIVVWVCDRAYPRWVYGILAVILFAKPHQPYFFFQPEWKLIENVKELREVYEALGRYVPPDALTAMYPLSSRIELSKGSEPPGLRLYPFYVEAIADRKLNPRDSWLELFQAELLLAWVFHGTPTLLKSCQDPSDSWHEKVKSALTYERRANSCRNFGERDLFRQFCEANLDFAQKTIFDYVIYEPEFNEKPPITVAPFLKAIWSSSRGTYQLFRFEQAKALEAFCGFKQEQVTGNAAL